MRFDDHYARAVRTKNLRSRPETLRSSADIVGAAGLAAQKQALAMALLRFFTGDNRESKEIVAIMADMAWGKAHSEKVKLYRTQAESMAQTVFDWMRDPACRTCKGLQFKLMESKPVLSTHRCPKCKGSGKRPLESLFALERRLIARWLLATLEQELAKAGPAAMAKLAPRLEL